MGMQTIGFHGFDQQSHSQQSLARQNSWYSLTLNEVEGNLGRPLSSMMLDELLKKMWKAEAYSHSLASAAASPLQLQASLILVRAFSGKTVEEVWREIKNVQKMGDFYPEIEEGQNPGRESTLGETTFEDFLIKAGLSVADTTLGPTMGLDCVLSTPQAFTSHMGLSSSPSPSVEALSDVPKHGWKRYSRGNNAIEKRLKRMIKNRESAIRSRARKQAYQNELVNKISNLEEENMKLKKEKELDKMLSELSPEARYQLRRTSSF